MYFWIGLNPWRRYMITGSCCCGAVKFSLSCEPSFLTICHCSRCRKAGSSEFVLVDRSSFKWIQGRVLVGEYVPEPPFKYKRCFCRKCGSSLGEILSEEEQFTLPVNCLDSDPNIELWFHEHVASKPAWQQAHTELSVYES